MREILIYVIYTNLCACINYTVNQFDGIFHVLEVATVICENVPRSRSRMFRAFRPGIIRSTRTGGSAHFTKMQRCRVGCFGPRERGLRKSRDAQFDPCSLWNDYIYMHIRKCAQKFQSPSSVGGCCPTSLVQCVKLSCIVSMTLSACFMV